MPPFRKNYSFDSFKGWDHQLNRSVFDFKNTFSVFPNSMLANEVTYKRIDISADKNKILGEKGDKVDSYEYVRLGGFGSEEYELDFCLDNRLEDKAFILSLGSDPGDRSPWPEETKIFSSKLKKAHGSARKRRECVELTARFKDALIYAFDLHRKQKRKEIEIPYFSHLMTVAGLVLDYGGNENQAIAALLHDAIEDQGGDHTRQQIRRLFGEEVANIVEGCTDADVTPKPPWRERKEKYLSHLKNTSSATRLVSAADKLANLRNILADYKIIGEKLWTRFNGGKEGTLWYYEELAKFFAKNGPQELGKEMEKTLKELKEILMGEPTQQEIDQFIKEILVEDYDKNTYAMQINLGPETPRKSK